MATPAHIVPVRYYDGLVAELQALQMQNQEEAGFLSSDPRVPRMLDLQNEIEEIELMLAGL